MTRWFLASVAFALLVPAATSAEPQPRATVLRATVRFSRPADPRGAGRLVLDGDCLAGTGLRSIDPLAGGLRLSIGPVVLLDGEAPPEGTRLRSRGEKGWILTLRRPFEGRGRLVLWMAPASGIFRLKASGFPAAALLGAGPAGVAVEFRAGADGGVDTIDFSPRSARRWDYVRPAQVRPVPGGQTSGGVGPVTPAWRVVSTGYDSGVPLRRDVVVRDPASFQTLWNEIVSGWQVPVGTPPAVDWEHEMVVGAFLGTPLGRESPAGISIAGVSFSSPQDPASVAVTVQEFVHVRAPAMYLFNGPYCLVACPRADAATVAFQHSVVVNP